MGREKVHIKGCQCKNGLTFKGEIKNFRKWVNFGKWVNVGKQNYCS